MKPTNPLNPADFTVAQPVAVVDTFEMSNDDGSFTTTIDERFIDRLCENMNAREAATGDLCPFVIGHTPPAGQRVTDEEGENPVVGFARNWRKETLGNTGRFCAVVDPWIFNDDVARVKKLPRRSCEVWIKRCEVDPISLLGSSTPARDLGLMKFDRNGSYTYETSGELVMPDEKKPEVTDKKAQDNPDRPVKPESPSLPQGMPKPDEAQTGGAKHDEGLLKQILATLSQLVQNQSGGTGVPDPGAQPAAAPGAPGAPAEQAGGDELSDEEFEKLLAESGGEGGEEEEGGGKPPAAPRKEGEEKEQLSAGSSAGGQNTLIPNLVDPADRRGEEVARLSARAQKAEADAEALRVQLSRRDVVDQLKRMQASGRDVNPDDEEFVADLIALEPTMRNRLLARVEKLAGRRVGSGDNHLLNAALTDPTSGGPAGGTKRVTNRDQQNEIIRLAREKGMTYESTARSLGYTL